MIPYKKYFTDRNSHLHPYIPLFFVAFLAILSFGKILFLRDIFWDDNCWLLSTYASNNLEEFLNTGFIELRRIPLGSFLYFLFNFHKNTDYFFLIWQPINLLIQILTPIFLYLFLHNLSRGRQLFAFFAAVSYIVFSLDYTLPYFSAINYRIGLMLTIISFYLTERAFVKDHPGWKCLSTALLLSIISHYLLIEATVTFEPARLLVIGYTLYKNGNKSSLLIKKTLLSWSPFILLSLPLIPYKLIYKPYGIYEGTYQTNPFFFVEWKLHIAAIKFLLFSQWRLLIKMLSEAQISSSILSLTAALGCFFLLKVFFRAMQKKSSADEAVSRVKLDSHNNRCLHSVKYYLFLGVVFLLPPLFLLEFASRDLIPGLNNSHASLLQFGYAIICGFFLHLFYTRLINTKQKYKWLSLSLALIVGTGVFFNNLNLDIYFKAWEKQNHFWKLFMTRFPSLPEKATLMMDVRNPDFYDSSDLDNAYDLELYLNLLYAKSAAPEKFRCYKVYTMEEFHSDNTKYGITRLKDPRFERVTHFGKEVLDPQEFIFVYFQKNEFLVNYEILEKHSDVPYKMWVNNGFPLLPQATFYPLREKIKGLK
jgi:hypothetical protein